jgi:prophage tail gpP-like protein
MAKLVLPKTDAVQYGATGLKSSLADQIAKTGRLPPVSLVIKPLDGSKQIALDRFLSYKFTSSILIPVDTFDFKFSMPDGPPLRDSVKEGDIVVLSANNVQLATGLIDQPDVETDADYGETATLNGRDLMAQLEDQDAISMDSMPIFANSVSVRAGIQTLLKDTRITQIELRGTPSSNYLLASEPGESKLAVLQRFLEPLNCLAWMGPAGQIVVGKPNMGQKERSRLFLIKAKRTSNVLSMKSSRNATQIANVIIPIWSGQELVTDRTPVQQRLMNAAPGPARLFKLGHRLPKTVVVSAPNATDPQGLSGVNALKAGGGNILQAYAKREMARQNQKEIIVQAVVAGHFNELGEPYVVDTVYHIEYDRDRIDENMYLFQVDYQLDEGSGQRSTLWFCRLGTIVSDVRAP